MKELITLLQGLVQHVADVLREPSKQRSEVFIEILTPLYQALRTVHENHLHSFRAVEELLREQYCPEEPQRARYIKSLIETYFREVLSGCEDDARVTANTQALERYREFQESVLDRAIALIEAERVKYRVMRMEIRATTATIAEMKPGRFAREIAFAEAVAAYFNLDHFPGADRIVGLSPIGNMMIYLNSVKNQLHKNIVENSRYIYACRIRSEEVRNNLDLRMEFVMRAFQELRIHHVTK